MFAQFDHVKKTKNIIFSKNKSTKKVTFVHVIIVGVSAQDTKPEMYKR